MTTDIEKELTDVFLENDDNCKDSHTHQLVEDGAQQSHFQHLRHKEPQHDKHNDAIERIHGTWLAHQSVDVVQHQGDQDNVDNVFYSKFE